MTQNMVGSLSLADIVEIEMVVYAGLLFIALGIAFIVVRVIDFRSTSNAADKKLAGIHQAQLEAQRRKRKTVDDSSNADSRSKQADKTTTIARGSHALKAGVIRKPWGW